MAIQLRRTSDVHMNGIKALVYGQAGAGKTTLSTTMPDPIIISAESGLLSIQDADIPYLEVSSMTELKEAFEWVAGSEGEQFKSVILDSISEIGEVVLAHEMEINKDGRAAYGEMAAQMTVLVKAFRDLSGKNIMMTAKMEKSQDEMGRIMYAPSMPGNKLAQGIPYLFDLVMALRVEKDAENVTQRALMCDSDGLWSAKDRSGKLDQWESPDMGHIIEKIGGKS